MNKEYKKLCPFKGWVLENFPFIEADFDAITNYELLCKIIEYLNKMGSQFNDIIDNLNYLNNLDIQDEVDHKLDEMVEDGTLLNLLSDYAKLIKVYDTTVALLEDTTIVKGQKVKTLGYYTLNDEGGSEFIITDNPSFNAIDLGNSLYAEYVKTDKINLIQLGAIENEDITDILKTALTYYKEIVISKNYIMTENITKALDHDISILGNGKITYDSDTHIARLFYLNTTHNLEISNITIDCDNMCNNALHVYSSVDTEADVKMACNVLNCYCQTIISSIGGIGIVVRGGFKNFEFSGSVKNITMEYSQYSSGQYTCRGLSIGIDSTSQTYVKNCIIKNGALVSNVNFLNLTVDSASDQDGIAYLCDKYTQDGIVDSNFIMEKSVTIENCGSRFIKTQCKRSIISGDFYINKLMTSPIDCQMGGASCKDINIFNNCLLSRLPLIFNVGSYNEVNKKPLPCFFENINLIGNGYVRGLINTNPRGNSTPLNPTPDIYINNVNVNSNCLFVAYVRTQQNTNVSITNCFITGEHYGLIACLSGSGSGAKFNLQLANNRYIGETPRALVVNRISGGSVTVDQQNTINNINYDISDTDYQELNDHFLAGIIGHVRPMYVGVYELQS